MTVADVMRCVRSRCASTCARHRVALFVVASCSFAALYAATATARTGEATASPYTTGKNATLTMVRGIRVGHHTLTDRPTGCTVVVVEGGAVAGVAQRGAAPGTRETDVLRSTGDTDRIDAIALSGGSAYGLSVASGVVRWIEERREREGSKGRKGGIARSGQEIPRRGRQQRSIGFKPVFPGRVRALQAVPRVKPINTNFMEAPESLP